MTIVEQMKQEIAAQEKERKRLAALMRKRIKMEARPRSKRLAAQLPAEDRTFETTREHELIEHKRAQQYEGLDLLQEHVTRLQGDQ